jgi:hypothetical protein
VGGGAVPLLVKQVDGLNSTQAGGGTGEAAIATDLSYVMEGVDNALAIYSAASGARLYGPYAPASFFAPVYYAGDTFAYPQLYYDVMRDRWIVAYLEIEPNRVVTYLDIAVSQTNSPTQPTPGAQYNVYQFGANFEPGNHQTSYCDYETLGVEYWGLYVTCTNYRQGSFVGNTVFAINKAPMLSGAANPQTYWWNDALTTGTGAPALVLSPAIEEGVQDAEFVVATDAGYSALSQNLSVCALTNLSNIAAVAPTLSCIHSSPGFSYIDPIPARQLGGAPIPVGYGTKQMYYKAGRLFLAWTVGSSGNRNPDYVIWVEVRPVLDFGNPRQMYQVEETQHGGIGPGGGSGTVDFDSYTPSVVGTDEDDIVVAFNASGPTLYPGIYYTGRKAVDFAGKLGGTDTNSAAGVTVVGGTHTTTAPWGKYSACAISLNSVTRGGVWCVGEYTGSVADPGWNTRLYNLCAE